MSAWKWWLSENKKAGRRILPAPLGKDQRAIKQLSGAIKDGSLDEDTLRGCFKRYLQDPDPWLVNIGHPLWASLDRLNKYLDSPEEDRPLRLEAYQISAAHAMMEEGWLRDEVIEYFKTNAIPERFQP